MTSANKSAWLRHSVLWSSLALTFCLAFGIAGVASFLESHKVRPAPIRTDPLPKNTQTSSLAIDAKSQGSAEANMLGRLMDIAQRERVTVHAATFKPTKTSHTVSLTFELEGVQDAVWRTVSALEWSDPLVVFSQARAVSRDLGKTLTLTGDVQANWSNAARASTTQPGPVP